mgnify:CR=1 FL=1
MNMIEERVDCIPEDVNYNPDTSCSIDEYLETLVNDSKIQNTTSAG